VLASEDDRVDHSPEKDTRVERTWIDAKPQSHHGDGQRAYYD
jgi:hypothetical protein